jgi:anthraniloyl-CoA monooxygenase
MKVVCIGGGPVGLYFSVLIKLHDRGNDLTVLERNRAGLSDGWDVVFWVTTCWTPYGAATR